MYANLALRSARRSAKDFLIYIVTLTICVGLFYSFLSISSKYYNPVIGVEFDISALGGGIRLAIPLITAILLFLIKYVNGYRIRRKQKEFAIQTAMGMEQGKIAVLFFAETFIMGVIAIFMGIILGALLSQVITAMLLHTYGADYQFFFPLYPDTILITILFFGLAFCVVGFLNIHTINKIKIIDMLQADKKTENSFKRDVWMPIWTVLAVLLTVFMLIHSIYIYNDIYDVRLAFIVKFVLYGNIMAPAAFILTALSYPILRAIKRKIRFSFVAAILIAISVLMIYFALSIVGYTQEYFLPLRTDVINQYLLFAAFNFIFAICGFFFFISDAIQIIKEKSLRIRYANENLFLFGQITAKLKTASRTMALTCITLILALALSALSPVMSGWITGFLNVRAPYDIQVYSSYNGVYEETNLSKINYEFVSDYLADKGIDLTNSALFQNYFVNSEDFMNRYKYDFPVLALCLSDYNNLRVLSGLKPIELKDGEFTTQWFSTATEDDIAAFLKENKITTLQNIILALSDSSFYQDNIGENIYNSYTDVLYIFPDSICSDLLGANQFFYANTTKTISYSDALEVEALFYNDVKLLDEETGNRSEIRLSTLQINESTAYAFMVGTVMLYAGVILLIICFTVLALQQLSDSSDFRYRFSVLRKMGVDDTQINKIIIKQMGLWFGVPIILALFSTGVLTAYFIKSNYTQLIAYVGMRDIAVSIGMVVAAIVILLSCYFTSTWILFKRNIME